MAPKHKRVKGVGRRTVEIAGQTVVMFDGVDIPPPTFRWIDMARAIRVNEFFEVDRGIDRDRIAGAIRKLYGPGSARSKQAGDKIRIWRVK